MKYPTTIVFQIPPKFPPGLWPTSQGGGTRGIWKTIVYY